MSVWERNLDGAHLINVTMTVDFQSSLICYQYICSYWQKHLVDKSSTPSLQDERQGQHRRSLNWWSCLPKLTNRLKTRAFAKSTTVHVESLICPLRWPPTHIFVMMYTLPFHSAPCKSKTTCFATWACANFSSNFFSMPSVLSGLTITTSPTSNASPSSSVRSSSPSLSWQSIFNGPMQIKARLCKTLQTWTSRLCKSMCYLPTHMTSDLRDLQKYGEVTCLMSRAPTTMLQETTSSFRHSWSSGGAISV